MKITLLTMASALFIGCSTSSPVKKCITGNEYIICDVKIEYIGSCREERKENYSKKGKQYVTTAIYN